MGGWGKEMDQSLPSPPSYKLYNHIKICKDKKTTDLATPSTIEVTYEAPVVVDHAVQNLELGHVLL